VVEVVRTLLYRGMQGVAVALTVATLTFAAVNWSPGDMGMTIAIARYGQDLADHEEAGKIRQEAGLDAPVALRYAHWLKHTFSLDLGRSLVSGEKVSDLVCRHLGHTAKLAVGAMLVSLLVAFPLGVANGLRPGGVLQGMTEVGASLLVGIPSFVLGIVLILILSIHLNWLPVAGHSRQVHFILPALTLGLSLAAMSTMIIGEAISDVRQTRYYRFSRYKGLQEPLVMMRHGVRNAGVPIVTFLGLQMAHLLDGVVVVETLFAWPGMGLLLLESVLARDIPVIQGVSLVFGLMYVTVNMLVDLACGAMAPGRSRGEAGYAR